MKIFTIKPIANGYAIYNENHYLTMFSRKENAQYVANVLERVKEKDIKHYIYHGDIKNERKN